MFGLIIYDAMVDQVFDALESEWLRDVSDKALALIGLQRIGERMSGWTVPATVNHIVDGDTLLCTLDLGWGISLKQYVRLLGIDAPEQRTDAGKASTEYMKTLVKENDKITVVSTKILGQREKYGRILGAVTLVSGQDLSSAMVSEGHAKQYSPR